MRKILLLGMLVRDVVKFALSKRDVDNLIFQLEKVSENLIDPYSVAVLNIDDFRENHLQAPKVGLFNHKAKVDSDKNSF